ncbi:MAG: polysaccharide biosynthesis tyrosine autokinase [Scytonematopsis contorta HA4267-MV1]|jgi:capsular exopolysaccharide synthesis family protein|nr:polysaccharide biosynthesis tyrosine autokinase [Scytonematopsis contorta HA4267-MV1]
MVKSDKYFQPLPPANSIQLNETDEGGLNVGQVGAALRRRGLLIAGVTSLVATGTVLKAEQDPYVYTGSLEILTKPVTAENQVVANVPQSLSSNEQVASPESTQEMETTIRVLQSPKVLNPVVESLQAKYPELDYETLTKNLAIGTASKKSTILKIQYTSLEQKQVRDVLKALANTYLNYSLEERQVDVKQAIKFVQARINEKGGLQEKVEAWQEQLRIFRQTNRLVDPQQKAQEVSTQIATLTQQNLDTRVQLEQMVSRYQQLQVELAQQPSERAGNSVLTENARYQKILDQIQEADIEIKKRSAIFRDDEPTMITLWERKDNLLPILQAEEQRVLRDFQSRIRELQAKDTSLGDKIKFLNRQLQELATDSRDYDRIQQQLKIANDNLTQFLVKRQALQIELSQKQQPWKLLNPTEIKAEAFTVEGLSASAKQNLILGIALGMLLGTGAALLVDKLSNVIYSTKDIKEATGLPLLGVVPFSKELTVKSKQSPGKALPLFFEVFRSFYTNILLLGSDTPIRSLVISSPGQGDGKSTVAIQLALAAAAMGQKVLLVDANLRFPTLHKRLGLMNIQGLTDVISQDLDWQNVIERSPQEDSLYVMTAGPVPPDSVRLLASYKMQDLMSDLQASYDLVIYDAPPHLGFADANLLAANTNGMVIVAGLGKLKRTEFQQALEELQVAGTPVLGVVANKSKDYAPASYSYYQQHYRQHMTAERVNDNVENERNISQRKSSVKK